MRSFVSFPDIEFFETYGIKKINFLDSCLPTDVGSRRGEELQDLWVDGRASGGQKMRGQNF